MKNSVQKTMVIVIESSSLSRVTRSLLCDHYADFIPLDECKSGKIFFPDTLKKILDDFGTEEKTFLQTDISYGEIEKVLSLMRADDIQMLLVKHI
jgi:hypothetical protein